MVSPFNYSGAINTSIGPLHLAAGAVFRQICTYVREMVRATDFSSFLFFLFFPSSSAFAVQSVHCRSFSTAAHRFPSLPVLAAIILRFIPLTLSATGESGGEESRKIGYFTGFEVKTRLDIRSEDGKGARGKGRLPGQRESVLASIASPFRYIRTRT